MYTTVYDPITGQVDLTEFESYESKVEALPIDDVDGMRSVLREIPLDDYKPSQGNKTLLEATQCDVKDSLLTEDEMLALIQRLRRDDSGSGKSNIEYMSTYQKPSKVRTERLDAFRASLMEEKEAEEKEYYSNKNEYDECNSYYASSSNRFLNEIDELK
jgi:hypothetical protein